LACHASPTAANPTIETQFGDDGVSCRSCHGEASRWLVAHADAGLGKLSDPAARQEAYAANPALARLRFLGTPQRRAQTCVGCHVGANANVDGLPRREVDHDLIAAGHPRLIFDLASQSTREPRHWRDRPNQNLPIEWAAGQVAALHALADLALHRPNGPRLDFADQACIHCHRPLPTRGVTPPLDRPLGKPAWAAAYAPAAAWLTNGGQIAQNLNAIERASPHNLADALIQFSSATAASDQQPVLNKIALPAADAPLPDNDMGWQIAHDALLAELRARLAADPEHPRTKALIKALREDHPKD
jgi:hypothetical protein